MKLFLNTDIVPFKAEVVERPWGHYGLYSDNEKCTCKILFIKKGECLSLQYHFKRSQFYMALDNSFLIEYSDIEVPDILINEKNEDHKILSFNKFLQEHLVKTIAKEGDMFGFKYKIIHRATYIGDRDYGRCLDVALGIENDENDIIRLRDNYGREDIKL